MSRYGKGKLHAKFSMRDTNFGLSLDCGEHLPKGAEAMLVIVHKEEPHKRVLLPHQLYYEDLMELSEGGKYQVTIEPHYQIKQVQLFKELRKKG